MIPAKKNKRMSVRIKESFPFLWSDFLIFLIIICIATTLSAIVVFALDSTQSHVSLLYVFAVLLTARNTTGYLWGILASIVGVFGVNYAFAYPYFEFNFTMTGYPVTFLLMFAISIFTCTLTTRIKQQEKMRVEIEKEKTKANLLRAVSHDLRTPLTSIIGATSAVIDNDEQLEPAKKRELLGEVISEAKWLIQMVENLLSVTRFSDGGKANITKLEEPAEEILGEAVRKFRIRFPSAKVTVSIPDELLMVPMDAMLIEQVINNLLENAVLHGKMVSTIWLSVHSDKNNAIFSVSDDGVGISPDLLDHIFEGYYWREEQMKINDTKSMGIGLPVCKTIIDAHGGKLYVSNRAGGGAEFKFTLPLQ